MTASARLERLLRFSQSDPANLALIVDAANEAFSCEEIALADQLIDRHTQLAPLPAPLLNLQGLIALAQNRYADAADIFGALRAQGDDAGLRFNLAWAKAMQGAYQDALDLLDDGALSAAPRAPALKIHALHHLGRYDDGLAVGQALAERFPDNEALMGALATLSLDAEKADLARNYASRAGGNAEGRAALGFLALGDHETSQSLDLFETAIAAQPGNPRAWVGKGLGLLAAGDAAAGAKAIDRGAELFGDHIGSWVACGWAQFVSGDNAKARASFARALAIDENFSESHGGLAVMDIVEGRLEEARRRSEIALRLDRNCFGGALAKSLLLDRSGHARAAQKVREMAFATPIGPNGRTLAEELVAFGNTPARRR
jgi:tetratricopeptide (TPR) repeat protein